MKTKLLLIRNDEISHQGIRDLTRILRAGDLVVLNDSATLPASFTGRHGQSPIELRLAQNLGEKTSDPRRWRGVLFGEGSWRNPTEERARVPEVQVGDEIFFGNKGSELVAKIVARDPRFRRLVDIEFQGSPFEVLRKIYLAGKLIQYSHRSEELKLWDSQSAFASAPVSVEPPSASFPLNWELYFGLKKAGIRFATITHSAGLSSTGDAEMDHLLPMAERYWISENAANGINDTLAQGRRVIAIGTTVTRALESAGSSGRVQPGSSITRLVLTPSSPHRIVSGILTGLHERGSSHLQMLQGFTTREMLENAYDQAVRDGYAWHENGDSCLIIAESAHSA